MTNEVMTIIKALLSVMIAILCLCLSRYRLEENKKYTDKYEGNTQLLLFRLILTRLLKGLSIIMLVGIITKKLDVFLAFYIIAPAILALNFIFFNTGRMKGIMTFIKGFYYLGLTVISMIQFCLKNQEVSELALGFTLSLAIFESIIALFEGYLQIHEAKEEY